MAQRVLTFAGNGILNSWTTPDNLSLTVSNSISANGWGVAGVDLQNRKSLQDASTWLLGALGNAALPTYEYQIAIGINASINENPERVRTALLTMLAPWFTNLSLRLAADNLQSVNASGRITTRSSGNPQLKERSALDLLLGANSDDAKTILGMSIGTVIVLGIVGLVVYKKI